MPNHLSPLGIIHTTISIIAVLLALYALLRNGKIDPYQKTGRLYVVFTVIACLSSLPIMKTGHFTAGHFLAVTILVLLPVAIYAKQIRLFGKKWEYVQTLIMSLTLFFSMIPTTVETLTRVPISHPLADSPDSPLVKMGLLIMVLLFLTGSLYQTIKIRAKHKTYADTPSGKLV